MAEEVEVNRVSDVKFEGDALIFTLEPLREDEGFILDAEVERRLLNHLKSRAKKE